MRADGLGIARGALDANGDAVRMRRQANAFGAEAHCYAFAFEDLADRLRHVLVLARDEVGKDRDAGARPGRGKQRVRAVGFEGNWRGRQNRLEPFRML